MQGTSAEPGFERAVVTVVSPTQINTWLGEGDGRRKWAMKYIAKKPEKPKPSADFGTAVHWQNERYLRGEGFDFSTPYKKKAAEVALLGVHLLPPPMTPGMRIENRLIGAPPGEDKDFNFEDSNGIIWRGRMDVTVPDSIVVPGLWGGAPAIVDHKTSSNIAKYALTDEALHTDPQGVIYAYYLMSMYRSPVADLQWNYLPTKGPKVAQPRRLRVYSPRVVEQFARLREHGSAIAATHLRVTNPLTDLPPCEGKAPRGSDLVGDPCGAYGGCSFKEFCTDVFNALGQPISQGVYMNTPNGTPQGYATMAALQGQPVPQVQAPAQPADFAAYQAWQAQQTAQAAPPPAAEPLPTWATSPVDPMRTQQQSAYVPTTAAAPQAFAGQFAQTATVNGYAPMPNAQPAPYGAMPAAAPAINDPASFQQPPTLAERAATALAPTGTAAPKATRKRRTNDEIAAAKASAPQTFTLYVVDENGVLTTEDIVARAVFVGGAR